MSSENNARVVLFPVLCENCGKPIPLRFCSAVCSDQKTQQVAADEEMLKAVLAEYDEIIRVEREVVAERPQPVLHVPYVGENLESFDPPHSPTWITTWWSYAPRSPDE